MLDHLNKSPHEITPLTMAIIANHDPHGNIHTCVLEEQEEYVVSDAPSKIIDYACRFFGASLRGRQDGTRDICGITHKAPISIDPLSGMYFFPTASPASPQCSWIAHSHVDEIGKVENNCTEIMFKNGKKVVVDVSFGSMLNQLQRTAQFRYLLDHRIKLLQKHNAEKIPELFP
ncbi:competence protein ComK [Lentibacillus saliphilus]|uniref:competence protein ComK n=1 Tax=Lentibacillus saliphilus TaxID=2737028 RepID=UPI001C2FFF1B|nr:competence protein ComK [Lentibacillus saliphilus]